MQISQYADIRFYLLLIFELVFTILHNDYIHMKHTRAENL